MLLNNSFITEEKVKRNKGRKECGGSGRGGPPVERLHPTDDDNKNDDKLM